MLLQNYFTCRYQKTKFNIIYLSWSEIIARAWHELMLGLLLFDTCEIIYSYTLKKRCKELSWC